MSDAKMKIITTKEQLYGVEIPEATKSYQPVSYRQMIEMTMEELDRQNLKVLSETYRMARGGQQAMGYYEVAAEDQEMRIRIGWHDSYNKTMPVRWAIGAHIIVCENGMVCGDIGAIKRKHTGTVLTEYKDQVKLYVNECGEMFEKLKKERNQMKKIEISAKDRAELLGRMFFEEELITATQVGIIKREIENPSYGDYNAPGSVWELYNHCTVSFKEEHPSLFMDRHIDHHKFFTKEFEIAC